jgi:hypothetical protein
MGQFLHVLGRGLIVVSLLLCAAMVALWGRSYRRFDTVSYARPQRISAVLSRVGQVALISTRKVSLQESREWPDRGFSVQSDPVVSPGGLTRKPLGFSASGDMSLSGIDWQGRMVYWIAPHWFFALILSLPPGVTLLRRVRRRVRLAADRCASCGYDLRATPQCCPECGAVPARTRV